MKTLILLVINLLAGFVLAAQTQSPIPKINRQLTDYFTYYPREKVFIATDKTTYKPGETIWFRAFVTNSANLPAPAESNELYIKLCNQRGETISHEIFRLTRGSASGDLLIPDLQSKGLYFLVAYTTAHTSPEEISYTPLKIDPLYSNQWVADVVARDSICVSGKKNELYVTLSDVSGDIQKNKALRYQLMNGTEILEKGKIKTDDQGKAVIQLNIPAKTNGGPFICEIADAKDEWKEEINLPFELDPIVIRFYPEGGTLTTGAIAKIGFTAFNKWGMPVDVEGSLVNQDGKPITVVKTFTKGLGLFAVNPDGKQKLKLVISGRTGKNQSFELPAVTDGLAFSVIKNDPAFVTTNLFFADQKKHSISLVVTKADSLKWSSDLDIVGSGRIKIPAENLQQGINLLSVFSQDGQLLAERLVFADKKQQFNVNIQPEKETLQPGERMKIKVLLTDENNKPVAGNIAIAVADKFRVQGTRQQINESLLMESELETPFSLISDAFNSQTNNSALLDVFLASNHLKSFDWEKIRQFKAEKAQDFISANRISGVVTDKNGNKVNKAKVSLVNNKNIQLHTTTTNAEGAFSFPNASMNATNDFTVKATDPEGKRELNVVMNKDFESRISDFIANNAAKYIMRNNDLPVEQAYFTNNPGLFQRAPKIAKPNTMAMDNQRKMLATSTNILDVIKNLKPYQIKNNQIVFNGSENSINYQGGALLVVDGQQMGTDISNIQNISPVEVDHINISTNPVDIQRYTGLNSVGVIEIFQKKAKQPENTESSQNGNHYDGIYRIPGVFPKEPANLKHNNRTTLLWIPELKVDNSGQAEFSVTAGNVLSDFVIQVQGISADGRPGSAKATFSVAK